MRAPLVEFLESLEPVQRARIIVTHARLFGIVVRNTLVAFDYGFDGGFSLGRKPAEFCARHYDLLVELLGLSSAFCVSSGGAFAFARQTFSLLRKFLESILELPRQLVEPFDGCRVRE